MEENEAGEMVPKRKVQAGPWKVVNQPQPPAAEVSEPQGNINYTFVRSITTISYHKHNCICGSVIGMDVCT